MLSVPHLFSLIHSLSKSEKRYFRLSSALQQGDKAYQTLFDCLDRHAADGDLLEQELRSLFPGSTLEPARKHLSRVLLKSLRQYNGEKMVEVRLINGLQNARILANKGLMEPCFNELEKVKQLALRSEKNLFFVMAARQELECLIRQQFSGLNEYQLIEKQQKIREVLLQEITVQQHAFLYEVVLLRYWRNGIVRHRSESLRLNDLLLEEHQLLTNQRFPSFERQKQHLHFQSAYFRMTGDPQGSLAIFRELDTLFRKHTPMWADTPIYYVNLLDGILHDLRQMEQYDEMEYYLSALEALPTGSGTLDLLAGWLARIHRLDRAIGQQKNLVVAALIHPGTAAQEREVTQLPLNIQAQWWTSVARAEAVSGNDSAALQAVNRVLNRPLASGSVAHAWYVTARLLHLLIHFRLGNYDYLVYELRAVERKLKAQRRLYGVEKWLLTFLKRHSAGKPMPHSGAELDKLAQDPYEKQLIQALSLRQLIPALTP